MPLTHQAKLLKLRLEEQISMNTENVAGGSCEDYSVYKFQTGFIQGLKTAISILEEIEREDN